jgi:hypothetical protein
MNRLQTLLDDYAAADETGRLHLFLIHRGFRDRFLKIDLEEAAIGRQKRTIRSHCRWLDQFCSSLEAI